MQDTFARATHSAYAAARPSHKRARDDRVSCIQYFKEDFLFDFSSINNNYVDPDVKQMIWHHTLKFINYYHVY